MVKFDVIAKDIIEKDKFKSLMNEPHHGLNRYEHVMRVAKNTYRLSKFLRMDYISATRGALLHDYFTNEDERNIPRMQRGKTHPAIALLNAREDHYLNKKEENIIVSHMFPMGKIRPNCKESWIVTSVDKSVALYECTRFKLKNYFLLLVGLTTEFFIYR